jgi:hypothetical protein
MKPGGRFVLKTPPAGTFQALDARNLCHRFPALYRRLVRRGVPDQAYAGRQDVVWHRHVTRDDSSGSPARTGVWTKLGILRSSCGRWRTC